MNSVLRLSKILEFLQQSDENHPLKAKYILSKLGLEVDIRTIQRDIKKLKEEFMIPIENIKGNGYYLSNTDFWYNSQNLARFFELEGTIEQLKGTFLNNKSGLVYVDLEKNQRFKGLEYIRPCLEAIEKKKVLTFNYKKFHDEVSTEYSIQPYLLKEYQNRWYVIGIPANVKHVQTFGLDRIESIKVMNATFKRNPDLHPEDNFERIIGLNYSNGKTEKVLLKFTKEQGQYIKTLPLHHSQEVFKEDENTSWIQLTLIPNFELKQRILFYTPNVEIISPNWLREEIIQDLKKGISNYS
ncbi:transcriptional regulator [Wenyingzhuangia sp. 1_MG-2023]|nr:transcriptional regulator [Wenyingzhuangia sp. 1_MG-2023]